MKGLEIARDFFFSWGQPYLLAQFPDLENKIAAGRLLGSEVLGGDDEISRTTIGDPSSISFCPPTIMQRWASKSRKQ